MNEPIQMWKMSRCTKHVLSKNVYHANQLLPWIARRRAMSYKLGVHQHILEKSSIFNSFLSLQNLFSSSGLVKISASWSSVPTLSMQMSPFYWWSLIKWWRTSICFILECWTRLLVSFTALSLSHSNGTCLILIPKSLKLAFIQSNWAQQLPAEMYSTSAVESAILFCFFYDQDTSDFPNSWHVLDVLFLLTLLPA